MVSGQVVPKSNSPGYEGVLEVISAYLRFAVMLVK